MTNTYFEELLRSWKKYEDAKAERNKEREQIIKEKGWDSEELKAWKEREQSIPFPYTDGQMKSYWAWRYTTENELDTFTINEFLWDREVENFGKALREAGIKEFIYTCTSTALMDNIHDLEACGWKMTGLWESRKKNIWGAEDITRGLRFEAR
ncbi:MAG: hypothetical protein J5528_05295 [Firmicutes bacterium]|nr:hypothetical protein [Bacillota bacterium]